MGKQLNYHMSYDSFLIVAQAALEEGCLIVRNERTKDMVVPCDNLSAVTPDCGKYWFYLPELADLVFTQDRNGHYYPAYSFNALGLAMIEAGFSRVPAEQARIYVMTGFYDQHGHWVPRTDRITKVYQKLARIIRKNVEIV